MKDLVWVGIRDSEVNNEFVIQTEEGSGGLSTIVLNENNKDDIKLDSNQIYMVTKYCKNNIPVNIHILVSENDIILLPASVQNIELLHNKLIYKGCDYIAYREIVDNKTDLKLKEYAYRVGELMKKRLQRYFKNRQHYI